MLNNFSELSDNESVVDLSFLEASLGQGHSWNRNAPKESHLNDLTLAVSGTKCEAHFVGVASYGSTCSM